MKFNPTDPEFNSNFSNFDILWFDLETKVRDLVLELVQPMNDNVFDTRGIQALQEEAIKEQQGKMDQLEGIVLQK